MPKKKYSIQWESGKAVSFEINGVVHTSLDQISNPQDLHKLKAIMSATNKDGANRKDPHIPQKQSFPIEKVVLTGFSGIAAIMLLISLISSANAISTILQERSAPGRVVEIIMRREYENVQDRIVREYYFPVVDFRADDGRRHSVQMSTGSDSPEYEKGDEVTVLYDPQHPLDARIKSFGSAAMMWILPAITGILGISFLTAVLAVRRVMLSE